MAWIHVGSAFATGYRSPGYMGKTGFGKVAPTALPPISLGPASTPTCWSTAPGRLTSCSTCSSAKFGAVDAEISPPKAGCFSGQPAAVS
ncbi:MAG: hypothetical protein M3Y09_09510 [Actinomycetota bacterium]|nr:hypothetical protein [Actinomycetota bacterium]